MADHKILAEDDNHFLIQPDGDSEPIKIAKAGITPDMVSHLSSLPRVDQNSSSEDAPYGTADTLYGVNTPAPTPSVPDDQSLEIHIPDQSPQPDAAPAAATPPPAADPQPMTVQGLPADAAKPAAKPAAMGPAQDPMAQVPGYQEAVAGIQGNARAQEQKAQADAAAYQENARQQKALSDTYNQQRQQLTTENDQLMKDYMSKKVDPNRVWNNMGTGNKVLAGIAMILGGAASGGDPSKNAALQVLNSTIDRDIDAQKADLGKAHNLFSMNMQKFNNLGMAEAATRLQLNSALQAQLAVSAAKASTPAAQASAQAAIGQLKMQTIPLIHQMAQQRAVEQLTAGNGQGLNPEALPENVRKRAVNVIGPGGKPTLALAPDEKAAEKFRDSQSETDQLGAKVDDLIKMRNKYGWSPLPGTTAHQLLTSGRDSIISSLSKLHDLNRLSDKEFEMFNEMVPGAGDINGDGAIARLQKIKELVAAKHNAAAANLLENYRPGSIKESAPRP